MRDNVTIERISQAHPKVRKDLLEDYDYINEKLLGKGVRLRFAYVYRSPEEQDKLFNQKPKVTNAKAWQSIHQYGLAFDIVLLVDTDNNGSFETASWDIAKDFDKDGKADWSEVRDYLKSKGWSYGGDWRTFKDMPHFEKTKGLTLKQIQEKYNKKDFIKNTTYINI